MTNDKWEYKMEYGRPSVCMDLYAQLWINHFNGSGVKRVVIQLAAFSDSRQNCEELNL